MFNVSIREYFSVLNMFIVCIRNTARSKSNPLLCTHVDSYMFSTLHPPGCCWASVSAALRVVVHLHVAEASVHQGVEVGWILPLHHMEE